MRTVYSILLLAAWAYGSCGFSPLQTLISVKATIGAITKSLSEEIFSETNIISTMSTSNYIGADLISTGLLGAAFMNKITNLSKEDDKKLSNLAVYSKTKSIINNIVLIFMIIFTKIVENAI